MKKQITIISAISLLLGGIFAYALADLGDNLSGAQNISYSGRITKSDNTAINGEYAMRFSIWDNPNGTIDEAKNMANALWNDTKTVKIQNGAYNTNLENISETVYRPTSADTTERFIQVEICNQANPEDCDTSDANHWEAIDTDPSDTEDIDRDSLSGSFFAMNAELLDGLLPTDFLMYTNDLNTDLNAAGGLTVAGMQIGNIEFPNYQGGKGHRLTIDPDGNAVWGSGYIIEDRQAQYNKICGTESEGIMRYNKSIKMVEYCTSSGEWEQMQVGDIPQIIATTLTNGARDYIATGSNEDIDLTVTFDVTTDTNEINLDSPEHPITFTNGDGCTIASVTGVGNTRTITVTGCDTTNSKTITAHIPSGSALSDTKNPMRAYNVSFEIRKPNSIQTITSSQNITKPNGAISVKITLVGAGGGGGTGSSVCYNEGGGGGGGGGGEMRVLTADASDLSVTIGNGGGNSAKGGDSTVAGDSINMHSVGGGGGETNTVCGGYNNYVAGGSGGSGGSGGTSTPGQNGKSNSAASNNDSTNGGYGGDSGSGGAGGVGGDEYLGVASTEGVDGGGGGGGYGGANRTGGAPHAGEKGGNGYAILEWIYEI